MNAHAAAPPPTPDAVPSAVGATPVMAQYFEAKAIQPDALVFFRMGDFYELFFDDASRAAAALGIALTHRGSHGGAPIPMCGVPVHAAEAYLSKLIRSGAIWYGALMVFAVFPAMVYLGAGCRPMLAGLMAFLGAISYAIYVLHVPLLALADRITVEMTYRPLAAFAPWAGYAVVTAIVAAAWLAHRLYDEPVRRWLTARLAGPGRRQLWITPPTG